MNKLSPKLGYL